MAVSDSQFFGIGLAAFRWTDARIASGFERADRQGDRWMAGPGQPIPFGPKHHRALGRAVCGWKRLAGLWDGCNGFRSDLRRWYGTRHSRGNPGSRCCRRSRKRGNDSQAIGSLLIAAVGRLRPAFEAMWKFL